MLNNSQLIFNGTVIFGCCVGGSRDSGPIRWGGPMRCARATSIVPSVIILLSADHFIYARFLPADSTLALSICNRSTFLVFEIVIDKFFFKLLKYSVKGNQ